MNNSIVDFEVAKKLKELGFNDEVNHFYYKNGILDNGDGDVEWMILNHNKYENYYSAPTVVEMFKWLHSTSDGNIEEFINFLLNRK